MKYLISTEFVREHGDAIAQGVRFFSFLTYCGIEHAQFGKYVNHVCFEVYCDTLKEAEEIEKISQDILLRGWLYEIEDFTEKEPRFWLVRFWYFFA